MKKAGWALAAPQVRFVAGTTAWSHTPAPPPRRMVKPELVKAAFKPDGWRYAVGGETPRAFDFSKRRNLRVGAKSGQFER